MRTRARAGPRGHVDPIVSHDLESLFSCVVRGSGANKILIYAPSGPVEPSFYRLCVISCSGLPFRQYDEVKDHRFRVPAVPSATIE